MDDKWVVLYYLEAAWSASQDIPDWKHIQSSTNFTKGHATRIAGDSKQAK